MWRKEITYELINPTLKDIELTKQGLRLIGYETIEVKTVLISAGELVILKGIHMGS